MGEQEAGLIQDWFDMDEISERSIFPLIPADNAEAYFDYFADDGKVYTYYLYLERKRVRPMTSAPVLGDALTLRQASEEERLGQADPA